MVASRIRPKFFPLLRLSICWLLLEAPSIVRNLGLFNEPAHGLVRPGRDGYGAARSENSSIDDSFFSRLPSAHSTAPTMLVGTKFPAVEFSPLFGVYALPGGGVRDPAGVNGPSILAGDRESYYRDEGSTGAEESSASVQSRVVSRRSQRSSGVIRGSTTNPKTLMLMVAVTVVLSMVVAHVKYKSGVLNPFVGLVRALVVLLPEKPSGDGQVSSGISRTKTLIASIALVLSALLVTEIFTRPAVQGAEKLVDLAWGPVGDAQDSDRRLVTAADGMQLAALVFILSGMVVVAVRRVKPGAVVERRRTAAVAETLELPPEGLVLIDVPVPTPVEVLQAAEVENDPREPETDSPLEPVYKEGGPAVQEVKNIVRRLIKDTAAVLPTSHGMLKQQLEALEEAKLDRLDFEEHIRRVITVSHAVQSSVVWYNLSQMEMFLHEGKLLGHAEFLRRQLVSYHSFLQRLHPNVDRNFRSTVAIFKHKYDKSKADPLVRFVREEAEVLQTYVERLESRVALLLSFTDQSGTILTGYGEELKRQAALFDRHVAAAARKMKNLVKPDFPDIYAAPWVYRRKES